MKNSSVITGAFIIGYTDECWAHIFVGSTDQRKAHLLSVISTNARHTHCQFYRLALSAIH
ncbi:hypothetical protein ES332_D09G010900v1 [Gossypium tomentosum]|uniref:Uncharacterized protein n=1 Tax=Gossypium tomentosum TaxID=34277 RepID=A0A5D2JB79_GOSTO|nr:hypothetical protein ES332_D09G010900v1 [Gossypium tomentosum]